MTIITSNIARMQLYMRLHLTQQALGVINSLLTNYHVKSITKTLFPVHADTIIDKILIKTLTTASGVVTMKDKSGNDSVLNINDSIDLRKELIIKSMVNRSISGYIS